MSTKPKVDVFVTDRYTKRALSYFAVDEKVVEIGFSGARANFNPRYDVLEEALNTKLHPLIDDFYRIALAVYISDLRFKRRARVPNRTIRVLISVSDYGLWNNHKQSLEAVLYQLSGDNFVFHFVQGKKARRRFATSEDNDPNQAVSLLSGGLDSLSGVSWLAQRNLSPILVSHSSQTKAASLQWSLATRLEKLLGTHLEFHQINAVRMGPELKAKEGSQRLRSFLYLTLGCLFALHKGISSVHMFENGILALNVPIANSRIFLNTRTAHPAFLNMYEDLVQRIFGTKLDVVNPFMEKTKAEVVSLLDRKGFRDLIKSTISCSRLRALIFSRTPVSEIWHCGVCLPCIIRRIAIDVAGLSDFDVLYAEDVLHNFKNLPPEGRRVILELLEFNRKLRECKGAHEVLENFPAFFVEGIDPNPLIDMYVRYTNEVKEFFHKSPSLRREFTL